MDIKILLGGGMQNYIFDLDGTLINSSDEVMICFEKAFEKSNYPLDKTRLTHNIIGPPLFDIVSGLAPELKNIEKLEEIVQNFCYFYDKKDDDISRVYDGVYEVLNTLKSSDKRLFIATLKPTVSTKRIIKQYNLDYFEDIYTIDKFGYSMNKTQMLTNIIEKYNLDNSTTLMLGDTTTDMIAAKNNNILAIGALWGYGENKEPLKQISDMVISNIKEIQGI